MTGKELDVHLDGRFIGRLSQSSSGNLTFEYDDGYRTAAGVTPLSLSMPLASSRHRRGAVLPWLQGLLPDNDEALRAMGRRFGASPNNPFALLEHVGADAAGAVQIVGVDQSASDTGSRESVRRVSDVEVATMLDHVVAEYADGMPYSGDAGRFSLAGAQPKIALHRLPDESWAVPEDATPTTHILKPVVGSFRRIDVVEQLTMGAAAHLGNDVARTELMRIGDRDVLVSERYDRKIIDGTWRRLHQEDLCQALAVPPSKKYQHRDGGPGVAEVAGLIRSFPLTADRTSVGAAFYRAFVFNIVAGCTDAHAKNYSLMLDGRSVRLAPLYDLLSYAGYWDGSSRIDSAMSVDGEYAFDRISTRGLVRAGARFGVDDQEAVEIVEFTRRGMVEAFEAARVSVAGYDAEARSIADDVLRGVRRLPLTYP